MTPDPDLDMSEKIFPTLMVFSGVVAILFGTQNLHISYDFVRSPLDRSSWSSPAREAPVHVSDGWAVGGRENLLPEEDEDFLPILLPSENEVKFAPDLTSSSEEEILLVDSLRGELTNAQVRANPPDKVNMRPERLVIDSIGVDASIVPVSFHEVEYLGKTYKQWTAPNQNQLGWHEDSAYLDRSGNTVINGHSSGYNEIFRDLNSLENGDIIRVYSGSMRFDYAVANSLILKERWESVETRMDNARWINPSRDERLTLISCWPHKSNTHRVVVVAIPINNQDLKPAVEGTH